MISLPSACNVLVYVQFCNLSPVPIADDGCAVRYRFTFPRLHGQFVGTGDVFASLLVVWLKEFDGDAAKVMITYLSLSFSLLIVLYIREDKYRHIFSELWKLVPGRNVGDLCNSATLPFTVTFSVLFNFPISGG